MHEHKMLPGVKLSEDMIFTADDKEAVEGKDLLIMAVASAYTRQTAHRIASLTAEGQKILNVAKGIEEHTLMTLSEIIEQEIPQADVAVMSGPSHAEEVGRGIPTSIVVGAKSKATAEYIQNLFMNEVFRVYISPDVLGIELGGRQSGRSGVRRQHESGADYQRYHGDCTAGYGHGGEVRNFLRPDRNRGFDRNLCQYAFPKPQGGYPYRSG